jgi:L-seryl-tRNA(Ser) seleniumtransferase
MADINQILRELPSVDELVNRLQAQTSAFPRPLVVAEIRRVLAEARHRRSVSGLEQAVLENLKEVAKPSLRRVINATGVVLHTNLGRAPLPAFGPIFGYSNLEYDLETGKRGKRDAHSGALLERLLGCPAIAVNNNAAAVYLALHELAAGYEVIVSRGELIEIGDGFRIPDIMARSGAILREVGTTNKTNLEDYRAAITDRTCLILRVHPSNFHIEGFTDKPKLSELAALAKERGIPLYEDLGSGCIVDLKPFGIHEPLVGESIRAGVDLVSFSTDKLLGGPQSGIVAGRPDLVQRLRRNPMFRAFRLDKLICQALETSLRSLLFERWHEIPALRMLSLPAGEIRTRAEALQSRIKRYETELIDGRSVVGGGATPAQSLPTVLIAFNSPDPMALERKLRSAGPPVIARIENDRLVIDLRTVLPDEEEELLRAIEN